MSVAVMKTRAEQALIEDFDRVANRLPGAATLGGLRKAAITRFANHGLPHRRIEAWKYTDLRARMTEAAGAAVPGIRSGDAKSLSQAAGRGLDAIDAHRLVFIDGILATTADLSAAKSGHSLANLSAVIGKAGHEWVAETLSAQVAEAAQGAILDLNTAFLTDGAVLRVEAKTALAKPIHLVFVTTGEMPVRVSTRNIVVIGADASACIIESHVALGSALVQTNAVTQIRVGARARVQHIKFTAESVAAQHVGTCLADIEAGADYRAFHLTLGAALVRNQIFATFTGRDAKIDASGAFLARGTEHIDTTIVVDHAVPHCESRELFKGVLDDRARGVVQGKVIVRPDAQKTDGKQMAQVLMLSPDAEFDSKPELEIYADDVVCGHGSTSAQIDPDLVFYCRSRGIPEATARALLIESFVGEAIDKVDDEQIREILRTIALDWLGSGRRS